MNTRTRLLALLVGLTALLLPRFVSAQTGQTPFFSTGAPDGRIGMASRPGTSAGSSPSTQETEAADDFILSASTTIGGAVFTGLLPPGTLVSSIQSVTVEIYRVFPQDSDVTRTSGPPVFSTSRVPTRANSPSDVELDDRSTLQSRLSFATRFLNLSYTVANSVDTGIHPLPNQTTGGDGPVTGEEVQFSVKFTTPFSLPADHYFFVPQVALTSGHFLWLSAPGPVAFPGDLQAWIRNADLQPDWLRVGTDIVGGAAKFNASFALFNTITLPVATTTQVTIATASGPLTATVAGCPGVPTGAVVFQQGSTVIGIVPLSSATPGVATLLARVSGAVSATYTGDAACAASSSAAVTPPAAQTGLGAFVLPPVTTAPTTAAPAVSAPAPVTVTNPPPTSGFCPGGAPVFLGQTCPAAANSAAAGAPAGTAPAAPGQPRTSVLSAAQVRFEWTAVSATPPVTGYYLYTWNGSSVGPAVTLAAAATTYTATGLAPGSYICVTVSAVNAVGVSPWSGWSCTASAAS